MASEESASSGEDDFDFEAFSRRSSGSDSEKGSSFFQGEGDFRHELKEWAISTNTPLSHVSSLLSVLRKHCPNSNLPKDGRTLLSTPTHSEVVSKAGGGMHYFGVAKGVLGRISDHPLLSEHHKLKLQINVDGLPLLYLGRLVVIPLWYGSS